MKQTIPSLSNPSHARNLGYFSHAAALRDPIRTAVIDLSQDEARHITYGALENRLNRMARLLIEQGLHPGDRLALSTPNRVEFIEIMFGAMRAGIVPVPLSTKLGADMLEHIISDAGCVAAVVEPGCNPSLVKVIEAAPIRVRIAVGCALSGWQDYEYLMGQTPGAFDPPNLPDDHPAFQPYTSGSTGRAKGVVLTHAGQMWWLRCIEKYWPVDHDGRSLVAVPLYHKNAMAGAIKPRLHAGSSVVLLPSFEPVRFLKTLADYRITEAGAVPAVFSVLLQHRELIERLDFSALRSLSIGSAPVSPTLLQEVADVFGVEVSESYGLTEGGPVMIGEPLDGRRSPPGSCGVVWPEGEVKLVDKHGMEHPEFGELWVRNPGVTPGYHNLPEVNAERLVDGWLRTGDIFYRDAEGFFYFRGRTDDMFKSGGESVYPKEVENVLLGHPEIVDACVVPVRHTLKGHVPAALVMLRTPGALNAEAIKQHCIRNGPAYAHPRFIEIVGQIPLNSVGKNDRKQVARTLQERYGAVEGVVL